ncbi:MAG: Holliday junction resolvase RuvX [Rickettsiales bacterium]|nr:Holliday junction resolvase RuvX [Rickettsiales bacterium]
MIFNNLDTVNQALPSKGRLMALDVGTKRIGLALSDEGRFLATPKLILERQSNLKDFEKIKKFLDENQVVAIVIGRPLNMDGSAIAMTEFSEKFAKNFDDFLENKFPIFLFEERLTSFEARDVNASGVSRKKNKFVDDIAASFILQHFLDSVS